MDFDEVQRETAGYTSRRTSFIARANMNLRLFRNELQALMQNQQLRPFTCTGSPLACRAFIVGLNSATTLKDSFWCYWNDDTGFNRRKFETDYLAGRKKRGVRPRIDSFVAGIEIPCLETNIYAFPTKKASQLKATEKDPSIFLYLLKTIRPQVIFVHSNEPISFFKKRTGLSNFFDGNPVPAEIDGVRFLLLGMRGPLFTKKVDSIADIGRQLKVLLSTSGTPSGSA